MSFGGNQIADTFQQKSSKIETARNIQYDQEEVKPAGAEKRDYSDDEIKAMTPDEKRKLFSGSFKFKTDLLTTKGVP